jgi:hypothetical protein
MEQPHGTWAGTSFKMVAGPSGRVRPAAPAVYAGWQPGTRHHPGFEIWTLTRDIAGHPAGSSVSRQTLELAGFACPSRP